MCDTSQCVETALLTLNSAGLIEYIDFNQFQQVCLFNQHALELVLQCSEDVCDIQCETNVDLPELVEAFSSELRKKSQFIFKLNYCSTSLLYLNLLSEVQYIYILRVFSLPHTQQLVIR